MTARRLVPVLLFALLTGCGDRDSGKQGPDGLDLSTLEFNTLEEHNEVCLQVLPSEEERRWQSIDWQPTYADGLKAASEAGKPVMLWVMNGHPLGCT